MSRDAEGQKLRRAVTRQSPKTSVTTKEGLWHRSRGKFFRTFCALDRLSAKQITGLRVPTCGVPRKPSGLRETFSDSRQAEGRTGPWWCGASCPTLMAWCGVSIAFAGASRAPGEHTIPLRGKGGREEAKPNDGNAEECFCDPPTSGVWPKHIKTSTSGHKKETALFQLTFCDNRCKSWIPVDAGQSSESHTRKYMKQRGGHDAPPPAEHRGSRPKKLKNV